MSGGLFEHKIAGTSAFFQGYVGQYFSERGLFYRIISNCEDPEATQRINVKKFAPIFAREINRYISVSHNPSRTVSPNEIRIAALRFVNSLENSWERADHSGIYKLYPEHGICLKDDCRQYFNFKEGRKCGHKDSDPARQLTFLAFCEECGKIAPLHNATNLGDGCSRCSSGSMTRLGWDIAASISTYTVSCSSCGYSTKLRFKACTHKDKHARSIASIEPTNFLPRSARAGTVSHPVVMVIPDMPSEDQLDSKGRVNVKKEIEFSGAFAEVFGQEAEEGLIYNPLFIEALWAKKEFWESREISLLRSKQSSSSLNTMKNGNKGEFIQFLINRALADYNSGFFDKDEVIANFGIPHIRQTLEEVRKKNLRSKDIYGFVMDARPSAKEEGPNRHIRKSEPASIPPADYDGWKAQLGLQSVSHLSNLRMVQSLLGLVKGSARKEKLVFEPITTQNRRKEDVVTVYVQEFFTEGVMFKLDHGRVIEWLDVNREDFGIKTDLGPFKEDPEKTLSSLLVSDDTCKAYVEKLLHTYSHMLIQQSSLYTGLSIRSIAEELYPLNASIFLYSTNTVNLGGLEHTYDNRLQEWMDGMVDLARECPQDPACMMDEGGACNACSFVPEFVCERFNQDLDRSLLVGGSERVKKGYLE